MKLFVFQDYVNFNYDVTLWLLWLPHLFKLIVFRTLAPADFFLFFIAVVDNHVFNHLYFRFS